MQKIMVISKKLYDESYYNFQVFAWTIREKIQFFAVKR